VEEIPDPDSIQLLPDTQTVTAKSGTSEITISSKAEMTVFRPSKITTDKFKVLHDFALGNVAQNLANDLDAGKVTIDNGVLDVNLSVAERDAQTNLKTMLYAEPALGVYKSLQLLSLEGSSTRTEITERNQQVAEVFFATEDAQTTKTRENKPPSVDGIQFSNSKPRPGDQITATLKGSDPEDFALNWEWSWVGKNVKQSGTLDGNTVTAEGLKIDDKAADNDTYKIQVKLTDELGASVTSEMAIDAVKPKEPPQITSIQGSSRVRRNDYGRVKVTGKDADGKDNDLRWSFTATDQRKTSILESKREGARGSFTFRNKVERDAPSIQMTLSDKDALTATRIFAYQAVRNSDPLVLDLNDDGKVDLTGGEVASKPVALPSGVWNIRVVSNSNNARYIINDANIGNGAHNGDQSTNASGQWKIGIETEQNGWQAETPVIKFNEDTVATISGGGMVLEATQTSDAELYQKGDMSVNSVGGEMVEFDMQPDRSSWEFSSQTYRPGIGAPSLRRGQVKYDSGKTEKIGQKWREDSNKGNKAKLFNADGAWAGEWIGGDKPTYFYGERKDQEKTQWIAGNGDGILVWDHNGNGIIDDNTELMSEYNIEGKEVFANGFEKLAHYFDIDENGVITAQEFKGLRVWVDDGDAKTEEGELQTLQQHGITEIRVPVDGNDFVGDTTKQEITEITDTGSAGRQPLEEEVENDNQEEDTKPISKIKGTLTLSSVAGFMLMPEKDSGNKGFDEIDKKLAKIKTDKSLKEDERKKEQENLQSERKKLEEQRHAIMQDAESVFNAQHQQSNDEVQSAIGQKLVKGIWTSADDVYSHRSDIAKELEATITSNTSHLPLAVTDFELSTLRVDIVGSNDLPSPESIVALAESLQQKSGFNEDFYLASYADVARAVESGHFKDGREHFDEYGDNEGRNGAYIGDKYDFDEVYYLSENPDVAMAIIQGQFRSGAHHFWSKGRDQGLQKNEGNAELLSRIDLDTSPYEKATQLPTQTRQTTDGDFTLGFRNRGSSVENQLEGLFNGDIYPDAYLEIHDAANKMDPESRRTLKATTQPLINLGRVLEQSASEALESKSAIPSFITDSNAVADELASVAEQIAEYRIAKEQQAVDEQQAEVEFLKEFRENWQKQQSDQSDTLSKTDLFKAVQDANKALGQEKPNATLLKGLRDILEDDSKPKS